MPKRGKPGSCSPPAKCCRKSRRSLMQCNTSENEIICEAQLQTQQETLVVRGERIIFKNQQIKACPSPSSIWKVYRNKTKAPSGKYQYAFEHSRKQMHLILEGSNVKLKPVTDFLEKKECLFEWCNERGNSGSLKSVAKEDMYLGKQEGNLISCSDNPAVFLFPGTRD